MCWTTFWPRGPSSGTVLIIIIIVFTRRGNAPSQNQSKNKTLAGYAEQAKITIK